MVRGVVAGASERVKTCTVTYEVKGDAWSPFCLCSVAQHPKLIGKGLQTT